ncbi:glypican-5 isoform X1 [Oryzias latipes]|uniref:Glypican 5a n=1 Tax=Oryzias latipes TaxID=8090 RepID=A0A3B3IJN1_ORYLA|nr:glypican-5 isoform X1 [Oryzias latipes]
MAVLWTCCVFLACCCGSALGSPKNCDKVREVFMSLGPSQLLLGPTTGKDLQVCMSKNSTCCTKKMEEKYQVAARRQIQTHLQASSSGLKLLISRYVAAFQETFEVLIRQAENHTNAIFHMSYPNMADHAVSTVGELFTDVGLFLLGSELSVDEFVQRFFDALFPLVYKHLINPGLGDVSPGYAECVRSLSRDVRPFGAAPGLLADQITSSGVSGKLLLQALHLSIEVINTTDHLQLSRECRRALLKMQFCPHCQGLTQSKPCRGYCLNVMRGCLASMAEIDTHWREFVSSLEGLSARMHGTLDLEQVLLGVHTLLHHAVGHALENGAPLSKQVQKVCGPPGRKPAESVSVRHSSRRASLPLQAPVKVTGEAFTSKRRDFLRTLRPYSTFYGSLADQLCDRYLSSGDGWLCWNGTSMVESYTVRVVGSGVRAQSANPEVKVKGTDPVINQIIDKLKHINQLLQGKSIPKLGSLDQIETGSGDGEGRYSGECDDEDGCAGSGGGESKSKVSKVFKLVPDVISDYKHHNHHPPFAKDPEIGGRSNSVRLIGTIWVPVLPCLHMLLVW